MINKNNLKKLFALILIIILLANMISVATGHVSLTGFWIIVLIIGAISYVTFREKN